MTAQSKQFYAERIQQLSEEVGRIAETLADLSAGFEGPPAAPDEDANLEMLPVSQEAVAWLIRARRVRARYLPPELFCEPAWEILLDLLRAEIARQQVSVSSLCIAAGVPGTTALRCIKKMVDEGIILRRDDPADARRTFLELSPGVSCALRRYFAEVVEPGRHDR
jgi:hypothetical protein